MSADKAIRRLTAAAVLLVAAIAAVVSFVHIEHLAVTHGQTQLAALLLPVSVDGTVAAASLSMLWAARTGLPAPWLARAMLTLGVAATLAANVGYGAPYGLSGELLSGWPAVAFIGSVEMALMMVRRSRVVAVPGDVTDAPAVTNGAPGFIHEAQKVFAGQIVAGEVPTVRAIRSQLGVGSHRAQQVRAHIEALTKREGVSAVTSRR
jgi:hypothetical protein